MSPKTAKQPQETSGKKTIKEKAESGISSEWRGRYSSDGYSLDFPLF